MEVCVPREPGFFRGCFDCKNSAVGHLINVSEGLRERDLDTVSKESQGAAHTAAIIRMTNIGLQLRE